MRILVLLAVVNCAYADRLTFDEFMAQFNKTYKSAAALAVARYNFERQSAFVQSFNASQNYTFSVEINKFSDMSRYVKTRVNGFKLSIFSMMLDPIDNELLARSNLPDSVDWRKSGVVGRAVDQGYFCGSCWAFTTVAALESAIAIKRKTPVVKLSEQQFIDCNYDAKVGNYGCDGGFMAIGLAYAVNNDVTTGIRYPYTEARGECAYNKTQTKFTFAQPVMLPIGDEEALKTAVALFGPVAVAIDASQESFFGYSSGIYYDSICTQWINHAVLLIGYGTDPIGGDYWILKNTWGEDWGENGFFKLARNRNNHCGIAKYAVYIRVIKLL